MEYADIAERVGEARAAGAPLSIRGGGSKEFIGRTPQGEAFDVSSCRGIVDYDPSELVISARCGTPLTELEALLAEHGQMLPFEAPVYAPDATIGGAVAAGLSGPRRPWTGSLRDFVLGAVCVDGRGELLRFGGRVMKNVAGYDLSRVMVGALGTLGVITEVSFKVLPAPRVERTRVFEFDEARAIEFLASAGVTPVPLSASCHLDGELYVRLSGSESGVRAGEEVLGGERVEQDDDLWRSLRNQTHPFFAGKLPTWRLSVPPAAPPLGLSGACLTEWGGALRWIRGDHDWEALQATLSTVGGTSTLFRNGDRGGEVFPAPDAVTRRLYTRLKESFDPDRILNPGRLYGDL